MPSTSTIIAGEESVAPPVASVSGESSLSDMTQTVHFSSGNPRIGETRGVMHLFSDDAVSSSSSSSSNLPVRFLSCLIQIRLEFSFLLSFDCIDFSPGSYFLNLELFCCLLDWEESSCLRSWGAQPYDICRFLPILWLLHSAHTGDANSEVRTVSNSSSWQFRSFFCYIV